MIINDEWIVTTGFEEPEKKVKSTKDKTVEHAMGQVRDALSGKNFRSILGAIEQEIRYAYKQGYEDGVKKDALVEEEGVKKYEMGFKDGYVAGYREGRNNLREELKEVIFHEDK